MIVRYFKFTFTILLLFACANRLISPPSVPQSDNVDNVSTELVSDYKKLQSKNFDCDYFSHKDFSQFPLQAIIDIHLEVQCQKEKKIYPKWLNEYRLKLILANQIVNDQYIDATINYTDYLKTQKNKISLLQKIIKQTKSNELWQQKLYQKLYQISPRIKKDIKENEYYLVARDNERNRHFSTARKYYKKILWNPKESINLRIKAWQRTLKTYKNERNKERYLLTTYKFRRWIRKQKVRKNSKKENLLLSKAYQKWTIKLARALWSLQRANKAKYLLKMQLKTNAYSNENRALIHWLIAQIWLEKKKNKLALQQLKRALRIQHHDSKLKENILWSYSFTLILSNQYLLAIKALEKNITQLEQQSPRPRLRFWLAYSYQEKWKGQNQDRSRTILENLSKNHPLNYYGILANMILKKPFDILPVTKPVFPSHDLTFSWLYYLKDKKLLQSYKTERLKIISQKTDSDLRKYFSYLYYSKDFNSAIFKFYSLNPLRRKSIKKMALAFLFPTPYQNEIGQASKTFNLTSPLIYSITRQESAFNPHARSHADAFGLMQIIPRRAKELAKKLNLTYKNQNDLYDPVKNITMGSYLLKKTLNKYDHNFIKTVASYNAGPGPVKNWFKDRFTGDYIKFIEQIPYRETRKYVKLTFRNYIIYKQLLSKRSFVLKNIFFENINDSYEYLVVSEK